MTRNTISASAEENLFRHEIMRSTTSENATTAVPSDINRTANPNAPPKTQPKNPQTPQVQTPLTPSNNPFPPTKQNKNNKNEADISPPPLRNHSPRHAPSLRLQQQQYHYRRRRLLFTPQHPNILRLHLHRRDREVRPPKRSLQAAPSRDGGDGRACGEVAGRAYERAGVSVGVFDGCEGWGGAFGVLGWVM